MKVNRTPKWMTMLEPRRTALFSPFLGTLVVICIASCLQIAARSKPPASATHGSKASQNTAAYDPVVLPISEAALRQALLQNSGNAAAEYQWLLRAGYQHQEKNAYDTMSRLRREQPNNPIVLDGYFMALEMTKGDINTINYHGLIAPVIPYDHWAEDAARADLQRAYRLAPDLWLTYAVDGEDKFYNPGSRKQGLNLLQKAEKLAPEVSYTHWLLGGTYLVPPVSPEKYRTAAEECKTALASGARISNAAFVLFQIYSLWLPNPAEEIKWKRKYYSLVPPDVKINPAAKAWLDRYPG